jgi:hypothetical protein
VLPDWFDLQTLRTFLAVGIGLTALAAIFAVVYYRNVVLRAGLAVVFLGLSATMLFYFQGPLKHCATTCDCRFLKTDLSVDGCATTQNASGQNHTG